MNRLVAFMFAGALLHSLRADGAPLSLVHDGQADCTIAVPVGAPLAAVVAAHDLQTCLKKISGAEIAIKSEDALDHAEQSRTLILVGQGELATACGIDVNRLPPEGFAIKTFTNRLVLAGRDDPLGDKDSNQGTVFAVSAFLEQQLGVRWLWPGPLGEVVPARRTIAVPPLDQTDAPRLKQRIIRDTLFSARYGDARKRLAVEGPQFREMQEASQAWFRRMRLGRSVILHNQHGFTEWWPKYHERHPEYFARHLDGTRDWSPLLGNFDRAKLCVSQPAVLDRFIENASEYLATHPGCLAVSAAPNDNGFSGHCWCDACKAWDPTNAPIVELLSVNADGLRVSVNHPALTDRYLHFYNLAGARLEKIAPGRMIAGSAYGAWFTPPVSEPVRSNVLINVIAYNHLAEAEIETSRRVWNGWARRTTNLVLRPNLLHFGLGYPLNYSHWLADTLRHCYDTGMMGSYWDSLPHHWAAQGLNYYVLARLLWDPRADVDAIINDYCRAGFGPAAPAIRRYFDTLEVHTQNVREALPDRQPEFATNALALYNPDVLISLLRQLNDARQLARGDDTILARIDFLHLSLTYARLQNEVVKTIETKDWTAARKAIAAKDVLYADHLHSFAIGVPALAAEEGIHRNLFQINERRMLEPP